MPLTNPYCSVSDVQRETGNTDSGLESWFIDCINAASRWIEEHCYRDFLYHDHASTPYTVKNSEVIGASIFLPWPIITLTKITLNDVEVPATDYRWEAGSRQITLPSVEKPGQLPIGVPDYGQAPGMQGRWDLTQTIKATGTFGYATPPSTVRMACAKIAGAWSHEKRRERVNQEGQRVSILDERIPDESIKLLKRYRRLVN